MTHVVTEACINCKHTDCVEACPADAFREGANFLVIDPELCVDCMACVPACPTNAIYADGDVPSDQRQFIALNAELARDWPSIVKRRDPLPDAAHWAGISPKLDQLQHS
ncbi:MAG TPA: ferredoxin FdxA [Ramlibacter sp.]|uniref:ferredoxin FdxA n=1 Tax=Ramlibacter sp. TaxID=1917967 RepID=UPI002D7F1A25|nr:ferredoxin FdxA [Ramlibacter sp.]HET8744887.1 ferredoxin FdxA [Ramlibacter sp.]